MRKLNFFMSAFALANGAFCVTMVAMPPRIEAAQPLASSNVNDIVVATDSLMAEPADAL